MVALFTEHRVQLTERTSVWPYTIRGWAHARLRGAGLQERGWWEPGEGEGTSAAAGGWRVPGGCESEEARVCVSGELRRS